MIFSPVYTWITVLYSLYHTGKYFVHKKDCKFVTVILSDPPCK